MILVRMDLLLADLIPKAILPHGHPVCIHSAATYTARAESEWAVNGSVVRNDDVDAVSFAFNGNFNNLVMVLPFPTTPSIVTFTGTDGRDFMLIDPSRVADPDFAPSRSRSEVEELFRDPGREKRRAAIFEIASDLGSYWDDPSPILDYPIPRGMGTADDPILV